MKVAVVLQAMHEAILKLYTTGTRVSKELRALNAYACRYQRKSV